MKISVRGELVPANITPNIFSYRWLCRNFMKNIHKRNQYLAEKCSRDNWEWKEGETFLVDLEQKAEGIPAEALLAIKNINGVINSPIGLELNISGYLNIILEGRSGVSIYNVHITENEVTYRQNLDQWFAPITMPTGNSAEGDMMSNIEIHENNVSPLAKKVTAV
jgi:hypothetical protein